MGGRFTPPPQKSVGSYIVRICRNVPDNQEIQVHSFGESTTLTKTVIVDVHVLVDVAVDGFWSMWLRSGPFEESAPGKPPALPEDTYSG
jgi:hypothetical protein